MEKKERMIVHNGVVITKLPNGKFRWLNDETTLKQCKADIDKQYGGKGPLGGMFSI